MSHPCPLLCLISSTWRLSSSVKKNIAIEEKRYLLSLPGGRREPVGLTLYTLHTWPTHLFLVYCLASDMPGTYNYWSFPASATLSSCFFFFLFFGVFFLAFSFGKTDFDFSFCFTKLVNSLPSILHHLSLLPFHLHPHLISHQNLLIPPPKYQRNSPLSLF